MKESVGLPTDAAGKPDAVLRDQTSSNQAAVYRLCGDRNPLHIDPEMASMAGFDKPILHGLCTLGYAVRHVLTAFGGNDTATFRSIKCRFAAPVFPGETIETQMWRRGNRIHVECFVPERKVKVLSSGYVDLAGAGIPATVGLSSSGAGLHADALFAEMQKEINADLVKKTKAIFHWKITDDKGSVAGEWVVDLKNGDGSVARGGPAAGTKPGCTITVSDSTLQQLALAELDPMKVCVPARPLVFFLFPLILHLAYSHLYLHFLHTFLGLYEWQTEGVLPVIFRSIDCAYSRLSFFPFFSFFLKYV